MNELIEKTQAKVSEAIDAGDAQAATHWAAVLELLTRSLERVTA